MAKSTTASDLGGLIISADWHMHCWHDGGELVNGYNARLLDGLLALDLMHRYAKAHQVKKGYQLGDVFHLKKNIPVQAFNEVFDCIARERDLDWTILKGNHDAEDDRASVATIQPFKSIADVIIQPEVDELNGIVFVPWMYDQERVRKFLADVKPHRMLMFHGEVDGAQVGPTDYTLKSKMTERILGVKRFKQVFAGHLHTRQQIKGVWYPGSLLAKDFGELETDKGFLHVLPDGTVKAVPLATPTFYVGMLLPKPSERELDALCKTIAGNFARIFVTQPLDTAIVKQLERAEPRVLQIKLERAERLAVEPPGTTGQSFTNLVEGYVTSRQVPDALKKEYIEYGLEALR